MTPSKRGVGAKAGKRTPRTTYGRGPGEIGRRPRACDCISGSFETRSWGTPVVEVLVSQGFTIVTIKVPVKFQFTCKNTSSDSRCIAVLRPSIVKTDFGKLDVITMATGGTPFYGGVCDGQFTFVDDAVSRFVIALRPGMAKLDGRVDLRFVLDGCPTVTPRDMSLVIRQGDLDVDASDYDGDGTVNSRESRGREWDPNR